MDEEIRVGDKFRDDEGGEWSVITVRDGAVTLMSVKGQEQLSRPAEHLMLSDYWKRLPRTPDAPADVPVGSRWRWSTNGRTFTVKYVDNSPLRLVGIEYDSRNYKFADVWTLEYMLRHATRIDVPATNSLDHHADCPNKAESHPFCSVPNTPDTKHAPDAAWALHLAEEARIETLMNVRKNVRNATDIMNRERQVMSNRAWRGAWEPGRNGLASAIRMTGRTTR